MPRQSVLFLLLSLCSGVLELGVVFIGIWQDLPLPSIVALGLAYQLGNLVPNPIDIGARVRDVAAVVAVAGAAFVAFAGWNFGVFFVVSVALGAVIQSLRKLAKDDVGTTLKRAFRIGGFLLAPLIGPMTVFVMAAGLATVSMMSAHGRTPTTLHRPVLRRLSVIMIIHQTHYFSYVYFITPVVVVAAGERPLLAGLYFALGWLTYTSVPHLLRGTRFTRYFITGHLFLAAALVGMALTPDPGWLTVIWIATGFGGGTVFCLERINERQHELTTRDLSFAENAGHVLGAVMGLLAYVVAGQANAPVVLAAAAAATAAAMVAQHSRRAASTTSGVVQDAR